MIGSKPLAKIGEVTLILCCVLATLAPFLEKDYPASHSVQLNLSWAFQYQQQFFAGQLYPRWLEFSNFGFGNATFVFYPPLSIIATLPFAAFHSSVSGSLVASMVMALFLFCLGFYQYAQCFFSRTLSLVLTLIAVINPYFLLDVYQRGAIAEVWAIVWIPWILWFTQERMVDQRTSLKHRIWGILKLALSYSLLIFSHLPTLLLFTMVWVILPWFSPRSRRKTVLLDCYSSFLIALGLSSVYLLPAFLDQSLVQIQNLFPDKDYYPQNRLLVTGLTHLLPKFSTHWFDQTLIPYFLVLAVAFIFGIFALCCQVWVKTPAPSSPLSIQTDSHTPNRHNRKLLRQSIPLWWCLTLFIPLMSVTDAGQWIYAIPALEKIQFSWRWFSLTVVPLPLILGYFYQTFARSIQFTQFIPLFWIPLFLSSRLQRVLMRGLNGIIVLGCVSLLALNLFLQANQIMDKTDFQTSNIAEFNALSGQKHFPDEPHRLPKTPLLNWHTVFADGLGLGDVYEYRAHPVKVVLPPDSPVPLAQWENPDLNRQGKLEVKTWRYGYRVLELNNTTPDSQSVLLRMLYYPGWQIRVDQSPWQTIGTTPDGLATLTVPPGVHQAVIAYRGTPAEQWGWAMTLLTLVGIVLGIGLGIVLKKQT